jgi:LemA protein
MKKLGCFAAVLVGLVLVVAIFGFKAYNGLVRGDEGVKAAWAQVENQLQRRMDLIPNLVETVKGYAKQESSIFIEVANARSRLAGSVQSGNLDSMAVANQALNAPLGRLLAISENYPQLKSDANFRALQDELTGTENRIATSRQDYNDAVNSYNSFIRSFPNNLTAKLFGASGPKPYFEAKEGADTPPPVKF